MCLKEFYPLRSRLLLVLLSLLALYSMPQKTLAQSSTQNLVLPEQAWKTLHDMSNPLVTNYDQYQSSLKSQMDMLQVKNQQSMDYIITLEKDNESLAESLMILKTQEATSESNLLHIQTALKASTSSTIKAQSEAKALEMRIGLWKTIGISFGLGLGSIAVYEIGHNDWSLGSIKFKKIW